MKIFAGYDCGGTKTKCVIADEDGKILSCGIGGPSNFLSCGYDIAQCSIMQSTAYALKNAGLEIYSKIHSAFFGYAGIELFSKNERIWNFLKNCIDVDQINVNNDAYIAWYSITYGESGIISISGTGEVTVGICEDGKWKKCGGWGYLIGDEGSGYAIGRKAINYAVMSYDGIIPKNRFEDEIMNFYSLDAMRDIIRLIYKDPSKSNTLIAGAAKCVFKLLYEGDEIAASIIDEATLHIAKSILTVHSALDLDKQFIRIGLSGGVFKSGEKIFDIVNNKLDSMGLEDYELVIPSIPPEIAALILSYGQTDIRINKTLGQNLMEQYKILETSR
ncbi:MAG TPA: hypothetical protein DD426_10225 [Clostridiaceae bacterium]|mgnify:CR=1 FL=1|nr:hypothetical protein [Clostridiaceae bacterium]